MERYGSPSCQSCSVGCSPKFLCRCLRVTETAVVHAIETLGLRTVKEIRQHTGAGDGCTCCHAKILALIERRSAMSLPMSVAG